MAAEEMTRTGRLSFEAWLDVLAPVHARLFMPLRDFEYTPMWVATFDLRAAMFYDLSYGNYAAELAWKVGEPETIWATASRTLASHGILLPRALFDAVWALYETCAADPDPLWDRAYDMWSGTGLSAEDDERALLRLLSGARDALTEGPERASRRRYGSAEP